MGDDGDGGDDGSGEATDRTLFVGDVEEEVRRARETEKPPPVGGDGGRDMSGRRPVGMSAERSPPERVWIFRLEGSMIVI